MQDNHQELSRRKAGADGPTGVTTDRGWVCPLIRNVFVVLLLTLAFLPGFVKHGAFWPLCDMTGQMIPFAIETRRMLSSGTPYWSWQLMLGDNFVASFAYYTLTQPLVLILCLLPYRMIAPGFVVTVYVHFMLIAWLASCYLRLMGYERRLRLVGSLLFTFSSFMVCVIDYGMFYAPVIAFLLLWICIERLIAGRPYAMTALVAASFAVSFVNYYCMVSTYIASAIYFMLRLWAAAAPGRRLPVLVRTVVSVAAGTMLAAVVLVPVAIYLMGGDRESFDPGFSLPDIMERWRSLFVPLHLDGPLPIYTVRTFWNTNAANIAVVGLLPAALYVIRRPCACVSVLLVVFLVCYLTPLNGIFTLFTSPHYSRWLYALDLAAILATLSYFKENEGRRIPLSATMIYIGVSAAVFVPTVGFSIVLKGLGTPFDCD